MASVLYVYDDVFLRHDTGQHPENYNRLKAIDQSIQQLIKKNKNEPVDSKGDLRSSQLVQGKPLLASQADITLIHKPEYLERVERTIASGQRYLDSPDTVICSASLEAAYFAVGAGLFAADQIMAGHYSRAFCAVRPPGHHAESGLSMGFCIFNNVAITARYLQQKHGLEKILIIDWDVHHGNATQNSFYRDSSVYYISLHEYPHYPGSGAASDLGEGKGIGYNKNYPMDAGSNDKDYLLRFTQISKIIKSYKPDFILISCGFDAHHRDPLSSINLSSEVYGQFTEIVLSAADSAQGRIISLLEGGYDLLALEQSCLRHIQALLAS